MIPTRRTQPYRQGAREPGPTLQAMLRGATANGQNPAAFDNVRRQRAAMQNLVRTRLAQRGPTATADVRGGFMRPAYPRQAPMDPHAYERADLQALVREVLGSIR